MPSAAFTASFPFILRWEGGFVDHPSDPGGLTNQGVTQRTYDAWRRRQGLPTRDVKAIEASEVGAIYENDYWLASHCDVLPAAMALAQFDTAVNMGVGRAVRILQTAVGTKADGAFGSGTAQAVAACDPGTALVAYCDTREAVYRGLVVKNPKLAVFLKGWLNRLNALRRQLGLPGVESADDFEVGPVERVPDLVGDEPLELFPRRP